MDPVGYTAGAFKQSTVMLVRHPQTVANDSRRYLGQLNAPLTELGQRQRAAAEDAIVRFAPDRIITSPLDRCRAIADPAGSRLGCPVEVDPRVIEMNFGILEGKTNDEALAEGLGFPWSQSGWPVEGAESLAQLESRTAEAASAYAHLEGRTAIVAHGGSIRGLLAAWFGLPERSFWQLSVENVSCNIVVFDQDGNPYLKRFGFRPEDVREGM